VAFWRDDGKKVAEEARAREYFAAKGFFLKRDSFCFLGRAPARSSSRLAEANFDG
jgi:hypothetical protein